MFVQIQKLMTNLRNCQKNQLPENQLLELQSCHLNCGNMSRDGLIHIVFNKVLVIRLEEVNLIMKALLEDLHMSVPNLANMLLDSTKRRNTSSQRTECPWRVNISFSKSNGIIKVT